MFALFALFVSCRRNRNFTLSNIESEIKNVFSQIKQSNPVKGSFKQFTPSKVRAQKPFTFKLWIEDSDLENRTFYFKFGHGQPVEGKFSKKIASVSYKGLRPGKKSVFIGYDTENFTYVGVIDSYKKSIWSYFLDCLIFMAFAFVGYKIYKRILKRRKTDELDFYFR